MVFAVVQVNRRRFEDLTCPGLGTDIIGSEHSHWKTKMDKLPTSTNRDYDGSHQGQSQSSDYTPLQRWLAENVKEGPWTSLNVSTSRRVMSVSLIPAGKASPILN